MPLSISTATDLEQRVITALLFFCKKTMDTLKKIAQTLSRMFYLLIFKIIILTLILAILVGLIGYFIGQNYG